MVNLQAWCLSKTQAQTTADCILHIITHHILFVILEVTLTPVINPDTGTTNYVVNETTGNVTVCLLKDLVTADDFTVTFRAQEKIPPDALCKIDMFDNINIIYS